MKEYSELRRLAEAATKCYGAMRVEKDYNGVYQVVGAGSWNILSAWHTPDGKSKDNAEFHAAASPDAVLELIAEVESLKKDAARYRWLRDSKRFDDEDPLGQLACGETEGEDLLFDSDLDHAIDMYMVWIKDKDIK